VARVTCYGLSIMVQPASASEVLVIDDRVEDPPTQATDDPFEVEGPPKYQTNNDAEKDPNRALEQEPPPKRKIAPKP